jgi:hypothetical protein
VSLPLLLPLADDDAAADDAVSVHVQCRSSLVLHCMYRWISEYSKT